MSLISQEASLVKALYFEGKKPLIIPHRGGRNIVPENTLHALENTFVEKFSHFETDLRMSKDGVIFLHHDKSFDRTTDVSGNVKDFNWEEIKKINAGAKFYKKNGDHYSTTKFVTLEDALITYKNMKFNLDLKQSGMAEKLVKIINLTKSVDRVLVSSFSYKRLDEFLNISNGKVLTSGSFRENAVAKFLPNKKRNFKVQALQAPYYWKGLKIYSKKLREFTNLNNLQLHIWTVNKINHFKECIEIGCDGVITDEPVKFRDYLNSK